MAKLALFKTKSEKYPASMFIWSLFYQKKLKDIHPSCFHQHPDAPLSVSKIRVKSLEPSVPPKWTKNATPWMASPSSAREQREETSGFAKTLPSQSAISLTKHNPDRIHVEKVLFWKGLSPVPKGNSYWEAFWKLRVDWGWQISCNTDPIQSQLPGYIHLFYCSPEFHHLLRIRSYRD